MKALDRKLWRDLLRLWSQVLTIALVVACGAGGFLTTLSAVDALERARDTFYVQSRFADVFAGLKRAPDALRERLQALPGVAQVETGLEFMVRVSIEGVDDPILGQLVGLDGRAPPRLNRVVATDGGPLPWHALGAGDGGGGLGGGDLPVWLSAGFAQARALRPGDRLAATINGKRRGLRVLGVALSPQTIFAGFGGMPDMRGFGVFWLDREALAAAYDMRGAFNRVAVRLAPGASETAVRLALERVLAPYGSAEAHGRDGEISHLMLANEIAEQRVLGTLLPSIFLGVAAFLLNVVISRLVATQREQIAALKALGYPNGRIAAHYLQLVGAIAVIGLLLGVLLGKVLGVMLTGLYADFFFFPVFAHRLPPSLLAVTAGVTLLTAVAGTLFAVLATVRLSPAEAMHPPAPGRYRRTLVERLGVRGLSPGARMVLRQLERRPWRSLLALGGVAAAMAIVVTGNFVRDAMDFIVESTFQVAFRDDVILWVPEPASPAAALAMARLPGVLRVEPGRDVPVRFVYGHRSERGSLQGWASEPQLRRIVDRDLRETVPRGHGLVMTDRLAAKLGLRVGDVVTVQVLEGRERTLHLPLDATVAEMMGLNAYMARDALNQALGDGDRATLFALLLERGSEPGLMQAIQRLPGVAGAFSKATLWRNMEQISARNIRIMSTVLTVFACVIAVGVVYNNARIALAERTWELASLRVLGLTRAEVSALLLGEMALIVLLALPLGMGGGWLLVHLLVQGLASDQFSFPVVVQPRTYAWAATVVILAAVASAAVVRRRVDRLDLVAALKTRE
jgi:putative ABC transport system permease protein